MIANDINITFKIEDLGSMIIVTNSLNDEVCYLTCLDGETTHLKRSSAMLLNRKVGATGSSLRWRIIDWHSNSVKEQATQRLNLIDKHMCRQGYKLSNEKKEV